MDNHHWAKLELLLPCGLILRLWASPLFLDYQWHLDVQGSENHPCHRPRDFRHFVHDFSVWFSNSGMRPQVRKYQFQLFHISDCFFPYPWTVFGCLPEARTWCAGGTDTVKLSCFFSPTAMPSSWVELDPRAMIWLIWSFISLEKEHIETILYWWESTVLLQISTPCGY